MFNDRTNSHLTDELFSQTKTATAGKFSHCDVCVFCESMLNLQMDSWLGNRKRILVLNREDMISKADRNTWANYFSRQGIRVVFSNGQLGMVCEKKHPLVSF